jgi:hypothetical protein
VFRFIVHDSAPFIEGFFTLSVFAISDDFGVQFLGDSVCSVFRCVVVAVLVANTGEQGRITGSTVSTVLMSTFYQVSVSA